MNNKFRQLSLTITVSTLIGVVALPAQSALLVVSGDDSIKQYDETTGVYIRDFVTPGSGGLLDAQGLTLGKNGNLFVSSSGTNSIKEYNGTTGEYVGDFITADDGLRSPQGLTSADDGSLFVVSYRIPGAEDVSGPIVFNSAGVLQYDGTTGELLTGIPTALLATNTGPLPMDVAVGGPMNNIFVSEGQARVNPGGIQEISATTGELLQEYNPRAFFSPQGLDIGDDGKLFYTEFYDSGVGVIDLVSGTTDLSFVEGGSGGLTDAFDVSIGENGNLFVSDSTSNSVKQYSGETGEFLGDFITSGSGGLSSPKYLTTANVPIPEPSSVVGVLALGSLFAGCALRRKRAVDVTKINSNY